MTYSITIYLIYLRRQGIFLLHSPILVNEIIRGISCLSPCMLSFTLEVGVTFPVVFVGSEDPNSGPHICIVKTFSFEPYSLAPYK